MMMLMDATTRTERVTLHLCRTPDGVKAVFEGFPPADQPESELRSLFPSEPSPLKDEPKPVAAASSTTDFGDLEQ
jgi:hypothetical protein